MDTTEKKLLEEISKKLNSSAVLNGSFDRLVSNVEHIKQKQTEGTEALQKIDDALYEPEDGVFSKLQSLEQTIVSNKQSLEQTMSSNKTSTDAALEAHKKKFDDIEKAKAAEAAAALKEAEAAVVHKQATNHLKRVAGEDLEKLASAVAMTEKLKTLHWQLIVAILALVAKTIFDIVKSH